MTTVREVTCPFCSLLCDDLSVKAEQRQVSVIANGCARSARGFAVGPPPAQAYVGQAAVSRSVAVSRAAGLLKKANKPLIAGLGTDVNGVRAALLLAEKTAGLVRHKYEQQALHNLKVMQGSGWIMTTLAEVKNRADVVILIGDKVTNNFPRFIERHINTAHAQFLGNKQARQVIYLGTPAAAELKQLPKNLLSISAREHQLANTLALLKSELLQQQAGRKSGSGKPKLQQAAQLIAQAQYPVFVWDAAALPAANADLLIHAISDLIRRLNRKQRAAGLALTGNNGGMTLQQVAAWQTGYPAGPDFQQGFPEVDPAAQDIDAVLWVSSLEADAPPESTLPTIALSNNPALLDQVDVYIPIGVPGLDHRGNLFRTDGIVNLPLKKLRDSENDSAADTLKQIAAQL
ncbi:MAG: hypothetical protein ACR2P9_04845 [Gammaproteobacteria bacterium]